jgi:two-component system, cell cycle sensor histidine kinase and response regulator CckA
VGVRLRATVLAVDDEPLILKLTKVILEHAQYTVIAVITPAAALMILEDRTVSLDLLVSDIVMPEMNGIELARRAVTLRPGLPVLLMTGYTPDILRDRNLLPVRTHVILKPFKPQLLVKRVDELLSTPEAPAEPSR